MHSISYFIYNVLLLIWNPALDFFDYCRKGLFYKIRQTFSLVFKILMVLFSPIHSSIYFLINQFFWNDVQSYTLRMVQTDIFRMVSVPFSNGKSTVFPPNWILSNFFPEVNLDPYKLKQFWFLWWKFLISFYPTNF